MTLAPGKTPSTKGWERSWPKTWTDKRVVAALAESCDFRPVPPPPPEDEPFPPEDIFACKLPFEQTCFTTPCSDEEGACKAGCESSCGSCSGSCASQCGLCEGACKDDACRLACAKTTAICKQSCARTMDRCASGTCAKADLACGAALQRVSEAGTCKVPCDTYQRCRSACTTGEACEKACAATLAPAFEGCLAACSSAGGTDLAKAQCARRCSEKSPCNYRTCNIP